MRNSWIYRAGQAWVALASAKACQWWRVGALAILVLAGVKYVSAESSPAAPARKFIALHLLPESLTLTDARDVQHVLVLGETESHQRLDLSATAGFRAGSDLVSVLADGAVRPLKPGQTQVAVSAAGLTVSLPVTVKSAAVTEVGFVRD